MIEVALTWADALLRASVQGGLTIAAVWALTRLVRNLPPAATVWLWRLAMAKLFVALIAPIAIQTPAVEGPIGFSPSSGSATIAAVLLAGSVAGGALLIGQLADQLRTVMRIRREATPFAEGSEAASELAARIGLRQAPSVSISSIVDRPVVLGPWHPAIVLPSQLVEAPSRDIRMVLAHELAHIKRKDLAWGWLPALAEAVFYFHPLVWLARIQLRAAQETACDSLAVASAEATPWEYGRLLLRLARGKADLTLSAPLAAGAVGGYRSLKWRIGRLVATTPTSRRWVSVLTLLAALLLLPAFRFAAEPLPTPVTPVSGGESTGSLALPTPRFAHEVPVAQKNTLEEGRP